MIELLATSEKIKGVRALNNKLAAHPVDERLCVVAAFGRAGGEHSFRPFYDYFRVNVSVPDDYSASTPGEVARAIEDLLVKSLDDTAEHVGLSGHWSGAHFVHPRVCDFAAHVLADRWKGKYEFNLGASRSRRDP